MGGAVFPLCYLTWDKTMVEVMKMMVTSFKSYHACSDTVSAPDPAAGHRWPMPQPETPGLSQASLGQSPVWSLLLSLGSWCTQSSVCAFQTCVSPVVCKFCTQILLASIFKFSGGSQFLCQIPRLGNLLWVLELS